MAEAKKESGDEKWTDEEMKAAAKAAVELAKRDGLKIRPKKEK